MRFFFKIQLTVFATVAIAILLASGKLIANKEAWKGLGLLLILAIILAIAGIVLVEVLTSPAMPNRQAIPIAIIVIVLGFPAAVLLMGWGREWLMPVFEPFKTAGLWWPIISFAGGSFCWYLAQSGEQHEEAAAAPAGVDAYL